MCGVLQNGVAWLRDYLDQHSIKVNVGNMYSESREISAGVPQGSDLGPVLFFVFINDLPEYTGTPTELYADNALFHHQHLTSRTRKFSAPHTFQEIQGALTSAEKSALSWHGRFGH